GGGVDYQRIGESAHVADFCSPIYNQLKPIPNALRITGQYVKIRLSVRLGRVLTDWPLISDLCSISGRFRPPLRHGKQSSLTLLNEPG
ncbi:MAG: hypothetical protein QNL90_04750, partial [Gammaproteobacteria bacterium]|nr:hypothetical protein [Gammaproteobacteria bacterium]MDX2459416.1 hypothetical protein [Gammaproteobacteria bacterium]